MPNNPTVTVKVKITNLRHLRWLMDQWGIENGLAEACGTCGWGVFPDRKHVCKDTIETSAEDGQP
jgi:hypothetical protein